jgi:SPP1 family predicted phage head-tail adaptor
VTGVRAGELRHRVTIQGRTITRNSYGEEKVDWMPVATVWAEVTDLSGREYFAAQQVQAEVTTRIRIRYRPGVAPEMRVVAGARTFDILAVLDPDGRRRELHLMCRGVVM